jgi:ribosomal protein S6
MVKSEKEEKVAPERLKGQRYLLTILAQDDSDLEKLETFLKEFDINIEKVENLGRRSLFFPVDKQRELILMSAFFVAQNDQAPIIENKLNHEAFAKRILLTKWNAEIVQLSERGKRVKKDV